MIYHPDIIADVARGRVAELVGAGGQHRPAKRCFGRAYRCGAFGDWSTARKVSRIRSPSLTPRLRAVPLAQLAAPARSSPVLARPSPACCLAISTSAWGKDLCCLGLRP